MNLTGPELDWARNLLARADLRRVPQIVSGELAAHLAGRTPRRWLAVADQLLQRGAAAVAVGLLDSAHAPRQVSADAEYLRGNGLRMLGDVAAAEAAFRRALEKMPRHEQAVLSLAFMLRDAGRLSAAAHTVRDWVRTEPSPTPAAQLKCGQFLEECRRYEMALEFYEQCLADHPGSPQLLFSAGDMALTLGQFSRAAEWLLLALERGLDADDWSGVWLRLAHAQKYTSARHPHIERFDRYRSDTARAPAGRAAAGFALGKAFDDLRDYAAAAQAWRQANALQNALRPWSAQAWQQWVDRQLQSSRPPSVEVAGPECPVLIVGLPRSGTSLVADRLGRHARIRNRGETNWMPFLAQRLQADRSLQDPRALSQAAALYRAHLVQDDAPAHWYVDKNPLNFRFLGLAAALCPQGRIVHCRRDHRDIALSIWGQSFAQGVMDFAYDFTNIRILMEGYRRLMDHWARLEVPMLDVEYEALVADPVAGFRRIGEFLGLPGTDELAGLGHDANPIATASVWQARQPVYRTAVARWEHYAEFIPELRDFA